MAKGFHKPSDDDAPNRNDQDAPRDEDRRPVFRERDPERASPAPPARDDVAPARDQRDHRPSRADDQDRAGGGEEATIGRGYGKKAAGSRPHRADSGSRGYGRQDDDFRQNPPQDDDFRQNASRENRSANPDRSDRGGRPGFKQDDWQGGDRRAPYQEERPPRRQTPPRPSGGQSNWDQSRQKHSGGYDDRRGGGGYDDRRGGYNNDRRGGGYDDRRGGGYDDRRGGGYNDRRGGGGYDDRRGGGGYDDRRGGGGYDDRRGGYNNDRRGGGYDDRRGGGYDDRRGGGYDDRRVGGGYDDRRGGGGYDDRRGGGGYDDGRGGGYNDRRGGGYDDRRGGGGYDDRRGGAYDDRRGGGYDDRRGGGGYDDRRGGGYDDRRGGYNNDRRGGGGYSGRPYGEGVGRGYGRDKRTSNNSGGGRAESRSQEWKRLRQEGDKSFNRAAQQDEKRRFKPPTPPNLDPSTLQEPIRLNKYVARSTRHSRKEADELCKRGRVTVNGEVVGPGTMVQPGDVVLFDEKPLTRRDHLVYILINKPRGIASTLEPSTEDSGATDAATATDASDNDSVWEESDDETRQGNLSQLLKFKGTEQLTAVHPLAPDMLGLQLVSNDPNLADHFVKHPPKETFTLSLAEPTTPEALTKLPIEETGNKPGIVLAEMVAGDATKVSIVVRGSYPEEVLAKAGLQVERADRLHFAGLTKKDLPRGHWRFLGEREITWVTMFQQ